MGFLNSARLTDPLPPISQPASTPPILPPPTGYGFAYAARAMRKTVPKHELPEAPLPANVVKTLIDDEVGWMVFVVNIRFD